MKLWGNYEYENPSNSIGLDWIKKSPKKAITNRDENISQQ